MTLRRKICFDVARGIDVGKQGYNKTTHSELVAGQVLRIVQAAVLAYVNDKAEKPTYESIKKRLQPTDNEKLVRKTLRYLEDAEWSTKDHILHIQKRNHPNWKTEKVE